MNETSTNDPSKPTAAADQSEGSEENAPHIGNEPDDAGESSGDPEKSAEDVPAGAGSKSSYVPSSEENKG